jgi:putative membrane protein
MTSLCHRNCRRPGPRPGIHAGGGNAPDRRDIYGLAGELAQPISGPAVRANNRRNTTMNLCEGNTKMKFVIHTAALALVSASVGFAHAQEGPTDPQIAAIVVTANQVDIDAGVLAKSRASAKDVKQFAQQMITDHSSVNKSATDLVTKLKVKPEPNATSDSLKKQGADNLAKLKTLKGAAFDKAYVDNEVTYHQAVLDAVDKTLIPSAKNEELKALLVKVRPAFVSHLDHAKHIQSQLKK